MTRSNTTPRQTSRRAFLKTTTAAGVGLTSIGYWAAGGVAAKASDSPNERVAIGCIGVQGKGKSDSDDAARCGEVVAICDVDTDRLAEGAKTHTKAERFVDFRELLDQMGDKIDAVTVSTPDHMHAPVSLMAMRMGKHCFCQKPLTRTIYEARLVGQVAREQGLITQMGNQGTASDSLRRSAHWLKNGAIGTVKELHVWTDRAKGWWPQGVDRPAPGTCPKKLDWDLWLGPAPKRPYADGYHPFKWRGWWDFGSGSLGDIACHAVSMPFMGLDLSNPVSVQAETSGHNHDSFPEWSIITFTFPDNDIRPGFTLTWYDGGKLPDTKLLGGRNPGKGGTLAIGDRGILLNDQLLDGGQPVEVNFPHSPGHFEEWIAGIRSGEQAMSNFPDYAGPLSEAMLLGNLAVWVADKPGVGPEVGWNSKEMKITNGVEVPATLIKPVYGDGYTLDV